MAASWVAAPVTIQGGYRPSTGNCRTPVSDSDPIETGRWLRTDIEALYCSHQNNDDSKCEAAHASLPDWPLKSPVKGDIDLAPGEGKTWHRNQNQPGSRLSLG